MKKIVAANWKMNKSPLEAREFFTVFNAKVSPELKTQVIFFVSSVNIESTTASLKSSAMGWGAQNCYFEDSGAFSGETSPKVLQQMGCTHCLVGHSERRHIFNESNEWVEKKVNAISTNAMTPMICVGETQSERESGKTESVVLGQLNSALASISKHQSIVIAYEPVWAIGTGKVATPEMAEEVHVTLRRGLSELIGEERAMETPILYGGSVKPSNAEEIINQKNIDGFLVGGASLDPTEFNKLVNIVELSD